MSGEETGQARALCALLEAAIFVSPEPIPLEHLARATGQPAERIAELLDWLTAEFDRPEHGIRLRKIAGGFQLVTKPEHHEELQILIEGLRPPAPLSKPALETAAIIAYKQPVTAGEIQAIRGVRNSAALQTLIRRKLIAPAGRKNTPGRPLQYKTTRRFLVEFGLQELADLPSLEEFRQRQSLVPGHKRFV